MNKKYIYILALPILSLLAFTNHGGGIWKSNTGNINFFSHTSVEDIEANNHKVKTAFDANTGKLQFSALIKDFEFEKALMQEHFNENYMESTKYPKATFDGTIENIGAIKFDKDGTYTSDITGKLTIKDVTKDITTKATFVVAGEKVNAKSVIQVNPEDYNITIPKVVSGKISRDIKVSIDVDYVHQH